MAKAISQRIQIIGGEEIKKLLAEIGQEAKAGFGEVEIAVARATQSLQRVVGAVRSVENGFANLGRRGRNFGTAVADLDASFDRFNTSLRRTGRNLGIFTGAVIAAAEAGRRFVVGGIQAGDAIDEEAQALGLSTQRFQELSFAAGEAGVKQETFATAMARLSQRIAQGKQLDTFTAKIYTVGEGTDELTRHLMRLADQYAAMPDGPAKTARAIEDFGRRAGPQLLPLLNQGSRGIEALLAKGRELGVFLSKEGVKASGDAARAFDFLSLSAKNLRAQLGAAFAPAAGAAATGFTDFLARNTVALEKFTRDLSTKAIPYIQAFFDLLAGKENVTPEGQRLKAISDGIKQFGTVVKTTFYGIVLPAFNLLLRMLDGVAAAFNYLFGTRITGAQIGLVIVVTKLLGGFGLLISSLRVITGLLNVFRAALLLATAAGGFFLSVLRGLVLAFGLLRRNPIVLAAALTALAAVTGLFGNVFKKMGLDVEDGSEKVDAASDSISKNIRTVGTDLKGGAAAAEGFSGKIIEVKRTADANPIGESLTDSLQRFVRELQTVGLAETLRREWDRAKADASTAWKDIGTAGAHAWQAIKNGAALAGDAVSKMTTTAVSGAWDWMVSTFESAVNKIKTKATELADFLRGLLPGQEAGRIVPGGGGGGHYAGGYTGNAGTRSVAGFVHGREYVQPAWVVAQPGVRSFMEMLRRSGDLQQTIARFGRGFRDGGFVNALAAPLFPGYAAGGFVDTLAPATAGRNLGTLTLQTDAGERFQVWTDQETASSLFRVASRQRLHSAGRKPSSF